MGRTSLQLITDRIAGRGQVPIIVTWNVVEYRKAVERHIVKDDIVLEVGCCGGTTTSIIGKQASYVMGIDQTEAEIAIAKDRFGRPGIVEFEVMDAYDMASILKLEKRIGKKFNKIFVDINGSRDVASLWTLVDKYEKVMRPQLMIIKSIKVRMLLRQCIAFEDPAADSHTTAVNPPENTIANAANDSPEASSNTESKPQASAIRLGIESQRGVGEAEMQDHPDACPVCGVPPRRQDGLAQSLAWAACAGLVGVGVGVLAAARLRKT